MFFNPPFVPAQRLRPKVRILYSSKSLAYITPKLINLAAPGLQEEIVMREGRNVVLSHYFF